MGVLPASYGLTDQPEVAPDAPLFLVRRAMDASITDEELEALEHELREFSGDTSLAAMADSLHQESEAL